MNTIFTATPPGTPNSQATHRAARSAALATALGATPPTTPVREAVFRAQKVMVMQVLTARLFPTSGTEAAATAHATTTVAVTVVAPRVGGVEVIKGETFAWTGGELIATTRRTKPQSMKAYRPQDFKSLSKMETTCQEGLSASHRLSTPDKISTDATAVSFQTWIEQLKVLLVEKGMDSLF